MKNIFPILFVLFILSSCHTVKVSELQNQAGDGSWKGDEFVLLNSGWIQGESDVSETWSWKGIPYAKPPVGELRWKAPRSVEKWNDVKETVDFKDKANQFASILNKVIIGNEDCLYLNVWRPKTNENNLPVYFWIHGGGNSVGSADPDDYHGWAVASRSNAVFVSINYRLGPLGWFRHPSLKTENELDNSGNYGLLDIIAALKWTRDNIEAFGGNPDNVTISGESAGANNTLALMLSSEAEGLFHKAIVESGYRHSASIEEAEFHAERLTSWLLKNKGFQEDLMSQDEISQFLLECSAEDLFRYYTPGTTGMIDHLYHIEDGKVFPEGGYGNFDSGDYTTKVPVIIGSNKDEMKLFMYFNSKLDWKSDLYELTAEIGSLKFKEEGVDSIAAAISRTPDTPPVYAYRFDWGSLDGEGNSLLPGNFGRRLGAMHTMEIPFFLGTDSINGALVTAVLFNRKNRESRRILSGVIMDYTANFIWNGDPDKGRPVPENWPVWNEKTNYLVLDARADGLNLSIDDKVTTVEQRLSELEAQLDPELYELLLKNLEK